LTAVWVPDAAHEALRDVVRAREAAKKDQLRARHRLSKFLLRHGRRPSMGVKVWTIKYLEWVKREVHFEQLAQEARGVAHVSAVTVVAELGELSRFARATQLMGYGGIVASENSSGERTRRGNITKTGNAHLRRVVVEAAWAYRHRPDVGATLRKRQEQVSEEVEEIAWKAQQRLHGRYRKLLAKGKNKGVVVTAIGRELLGFIWAIGTKVEAARKESLQRTA
jgi:transposase